MSKKQEVLNSKSKRAEKLFGKREKGTPVFLPPELGFECPLCKYNVKNINEVDDSKYLRFSEYNCFMWCPNCNIDIPSCFCKKYYEPNLGVLPRRRRRLEMQIKMFLDIVEGVK